MFKNVQIQYELWIAHSSENKTFVWNSAFEDNVNKAKQVTSYCSTTHSKKKLIKLFLIQDFIFNAIMHCWLWYIKFSCLFMNRLLIWRLLSLITDAYKDLPCKVAMLYNPICVLCILQFFVLCIAIYAPKQCHQLPLNNVTVSTLISLGFATEIRKWAIVLCDFDATDINHSYEIIKNWIPCDSKQ